MKLDFAKEAAKLTARGHSLETELARAYELGRVKGRAQMKDEIAKSQRPSKQEQYLNHIRGAEERAKTAERHAKVFEDALKARAEETLRLRAFLVRCCDDLEKATDTMVNEGVIDEEDDGVAEREFVATVRQELAR